MNFEPVPQMENQDQKQKKLDWEIIGDMIGTLVEAKDSDMIYDVVSKYQKVIIDYSAAWCGPCKMLKPFLSDLARENPEIVFLVVDVDNDECQNTISSCSVTSLPTVQFYYNQNMLGDVVGLQKEVILDYLDKMINHEAGATAQNDTQTGDN